MPRFAHRDLRLGLALVPALASLACSAHLESDTRRNLERAEERLSDSGTEPETLGGQVFEDGPQAYVSYALERHPGLRAAFERWRAATLRISSARRLPEPVVSYAYFIQNVYTRVGPQRHRLSVQQSFPWPTRLTAAADAAAMRARAMERRFDALALAISASVQERYWRLWSIRAVREIRREQSSLLTDLSELARSGLEVGRLSLADVSQIDLTRARLDDSIAALDEEERQASAELLEAIGAPPDTETPTQSDAPTASEVGEDLRSLRAAVQEHPALDVFSNLASASDADAASAEAGRFPSFTLGLDWIETGEMDSTVPNNGTDAVVASIGVRIPLWQPIYDDEQRAFEADAAAFRAEGRDETQRAQTRLTVTMASLRDSLRRVRLHQDTLIPQALSVYESVLGAYSAGRTSVSAVMLAQRDLLELRDSLIRAQAAHARAWSQLGAIVGRAVEAAPSSEDRDGR